MTHNCFKALLTKEYSFLKDLNKGHVSVVDLKELV